MQCKTSAVTKLESTLYSLEKFKTPNKDPSTTFTRLFKPPLNLAVPKINQDVLFHDLNEVRQSGFVERCMERQDAVSSGIMLDFDVYQTCSDRKLLTFSRHIIKVYGMLLQKYMGVTAFHACVIQRGAPTRCGDGYKDGLHVLVPDVWISRSAKRAIQAEFIERLNINYPELRSETVFDANSAHVPVYLYGSSKSNTLDAHVLVEAYELRFDPGDDTPMFSKFSDLERLDKDYNLTYELSTGVYLPLAERKWFTKQHYDPIVDIPDIDNGDYTNSDYENAALDAQLGPVMSLLRQVIDILPMDYFDYIKWLQLVFAIASSHPNPEGKELARWFSKKGGALYNETGFNAKWDEALGGPREGVKPITTRSIHRWAKEHDPEAYRDVLNNGYTGYMIERINATGGTLTDSDIGNLIAMVFSEKYITVREMRGDRTSYQWFRFADRKGVGQPHNIYKWINEGSLPIELELFMIGDKFVHLTEDINERVRNLGDSSDVKKIANNVKRSIQRYRSAGGRRAAIESARVLLLREDFMNRLDKNPDILGVGNGVLQIGAEPVLIEGHHDHIISKSTHTKYVPYDPENKYVRILENAFADTFVDKDAARWLMYYFSQGISGRDCAQLILTLLGGGANAKSTWLEFISETLGDYADKGAIQLLLTDRGAANSTNTALMKLKGLRFVYFSEPGTNQSISCEKVKDYLGGEKVTGNDKFKPEETFNMEMTPTISSNVRVHTEATDHGFWRRFRVYICKAMFYTEEDIAKGHEVGAYDKPCDPDLQSNIKNNPKYKEAMLSMLVHAYQELCVKYKGNMKNVVCKTIQNETHRYRRSEDNLYKFITSRVPRCPVAADERISLSAVATEYRKWYREVTGRMSALRNEDVEELFATSSIQHDIKIDNQSKMKYFANRRLLLNNTDGLRDGETF